MRQRRILPIVFITAIVTTIAVFFLVKLYPLRIGNDVMVSAAEYEELMEMKQRFDKVIKLEEVIKKQFYKDTDDVDFNEGILKGLFNALGDPYSTYYNKEEYDTYLMERKGEFSGVGINIAPMENGQIPITGIIENSPAYGSGIQSGDRIFKVDGELLSGSGTEDHNAAVSKIKGPIGSEVTLSVYREDEKTQEVEELSFTLVRDIITVPTIESRMLEDKIGYIQLIAFEQNIHSEFVQAKEKLEAEGMKACIIDVRGNPGGYLDQVIKIADEILGKQAIVTTEGPSEPRRTYDSDETKKFNIPFVILMNKGSASASEILVGAIQDTGAGAVFGTESFGKGLVQDVVGLQDGSGFKLTTSVYLTPNERLITPEEPLQPDVSQEEIEKEGYESTFDKYGRFIKDGVLDYAKDYLKEKMN